MYRSQNFDKIYFPRYYQIINRGEVWHGFSRALCPLPALDEPLF